jgi:hypothetical protein
MINLAMALSIARVDEASHPHPRQCLFFRRVFTEKLAIFSEFDFRF